MPGDAAHPPRGGIVDDTAEHDVVSEFGRGDAPLTPASPTLSPHAGRGALALSVPRPAKRGEGPRSGGEGPKTGIPHPQPIVNFPLDEHIQRISRNPPHDLAEELEVDVAVAEDVPRLVDRLLMHHQLHGRVVAAP